MSRQTADTAIQIAIQHHQAGRLAEAQVAYQEILSRDPAHADALHLLGILMHQSGQNSDQALGFVRRAIALNPSVPEYHCNLGLIFSDHRRWPEAIGAFQQALALRPEYGTVLNYLGTAQRETGRLEDAAASYQRAVTAKPEFFVAYSNLGNVLRELNRLQESADACRRAIALKPDFAPAHNNLGNALNKQDRLDDAVAAYRQALAINPQYAEARSNLGNALKDLGRLDDAIAAYREALALNPNLPECHSNLLYDLHYRDGFDPLAVLEESRAWASRYAQPLSAQIRAHANDRDPDRRLRIGYISADFRQHAVSSFLLPLLKHHDHRQFEIFCYSNTRAPDHVTASLRQCADQWRDIVAMPDYRAAEMIRHDGIDILVDLAGHTAQHRLLLLARKPAPIQITYLGYPGTTGLATIDYRLTDLVSDPPGSTDSHYRETLLRLPRSNWCFTPVVDAPPVGHLPALNLPARQVCFGCFNNFAKITSGMLQTWAKLLRTVPNSRLMIKAKALAVESVRQQVVQRFSELGISPLRLDLRGRLLNPADHLATYGQIDIALDTFPYHGTTTTCEALWMGVPVVTLVGNAHVSRVGASLLTSVGLPALIAQTSEQYIEIAARLAGDLPKLSEIRAGLREKMSASPLGDGPSFARDFEAGCRAAWKKWCAANPGNIQKPAETLEKTADRFRLAETHYNLGNALRDEQKLEEAVVAYRRAIEARPGLVEAYNNLANVLSTLRRFDEAIAIYRKVIEIRPDFAKAHNNLGGALREEGRFEEALEALNRAIHVEPNYALAYTNRGVVLQQLRRVAEAIASFGTAIRLAPRSADSFYHLGNALKDLSRADEAIASYNRAIECRPGYAEPYCALGNLFQEQGDVDQASACCRRAISLKPDLAEAHNVMGNILRDQGEHDLAIESYRRAIELKPDAATIHSNLAYAIHFHPGYDARKILEENRHWAERHERPLLALAHPKHQNDQSTDRRLKIGYVSPDFRRHPAACFVLPLLAHHDARKVEVFCYSGVKHPDAVTAQCRQLAHVWRDVAGLSDADLADRIRLDQIDILVDLTLHMSGNRLLTFARKPAPVQVTWLGYPSTTGMSSIDYRLSDPYLDPPGLGDELYNEKTLRLAHTFWCYQPPVATPDVNSLPALQSGRVTFACLNHFGKVTAPTLELWIQTLNAVANSRLIILSPAGSHRDRLRQVFERGGISPERIEFVARLAPEEYFRLFHRIDLCLDPIPYPGHTSTLDGLWMGVPAITLRGETAVARGGASILSNLDLPQFIAATPQEYLKIARVTAANLASVAELRAHLRQKLRASPLMNAKSFTEDIESAYREIWATWCA